MKHQHFFNCAMRIITQYNRNTLAYTEAVNIIIGIKLGLEYDASDEETADIKTTYKIIIQYLTEKRDSQ